MILAVEVISINVWPALQTMLVDGWVLRFANGYTKRANSINPLYPSKRTAAEKITACEKLYRDKRLPVVFKMNGAAYPERLDAWQNAFCPMNGIDGKNQRTHFLMLQSIVPETCFASLKVEDWIIACGLGVLQDGFIGLFDIVTEPGWRRHGYGERLVHGLLGWGKHRGAHTAYLQVMLDNTPSLHLYAKIGFQEAYQYWYRVNRSS